MKKSVAFLVLMFTSQVALGDFLWPRGNDFTLTFESIEITKDNERDRSEEIEEISELMQAEIEAKFTNDRSTLIVTFSFKDGYLFELICNQSVGSTYQCAHKEDPESDKYTYNIDILTSFSRLTGLKLRGEDNFRDEKTMITLSLK